MNILVAYYLLISTVAYAFVTSKYVVGRRTEILRSGSSMSETRNDVYGYNIRNELISAAKSVGGDDPGAPQSRTFPTEYAYQYDDIGNRITSLDLGTNRTYTANNLNQYLEISTSDAGLHTSEFEPQFESEDGNKNVSDLTDSTQSLCAHYEYTPFGALLSSSGSSFPSNPFRFSSEHADGTL